MNGSLPSEARERVLSKLPPEKRLDVLERSDKRGPRPNDPDWLLIETVMEAVADVKGATAEAVEAMQSAAPFGTEALAAIKAAVAQAVKERSSGQGSATGPWRDVALVVGPVIGTLAAAWTIVLFGPHVGVGGLMFGLVAVLLVAAAASLWREVPAPAKIRYVPVRELVSFAGGIVAAYVLAWGVSAGHKVPEPVRVSLVAAAGVGIGLVWRGRR